MMSRPRSPAPAAAPMVPAALALATGVVADRFGVGEAWSTWSWAGLAGAGSALAMAGRRGRAGLVGVAVLWLGIGGALHHRHWSDLAPDDLARGTVPGAAASPAWLRGVPVETAAYRPQ